MSTEEASVDLSELKKNHLSNLRAFVNLQAAQNRSVLRDYYESLFNTLDYNKACKAEQLKFYKLKTNGKQKEQANKVTQTNYNLEYCEYCRISYWPSNCRVYMAAKARITHGNAQVLRRYKLFDYKPKYKSFKDGLINKILNQGSALIYECKRCKSKNAIYKESQRQTQFKLTNKTRSKQLMQQKDVHKISFNRLNKSVQGSVASTAPVTTSMSTHKVNSFSGRKRFASLQARLKLDEIEQEKANEDRKKSSASIFDFLNKLN